MIYSYTNHGFLPSDPLGSPPFLLLDIGIERRQHEPYAFDNLKRPNYKGFLFQYTLKGKGAYRFYDQTYILEENQGFFTCLPEDSSYTLVSDEPWEFIFLHFSGNACIPFYDYFQKEYGPIFTLDLHSLVIQLALNLHQRLDHGYQLEIFEGGEFVHRFLASLLREFSIPSQQNLSVLGRDVLYYMQKKYSSIDSIQSLADTFHVSPAHLSRTFKQDYGKSPITVLNTLRIRHALNSLLNSSASIESIARECGFSNGNYFSKVFKKQLGISPENYRRLT